VLRLSIKVLPKLRFIDSVSIVLLERHRHVLTAKVGNPGAIPVATLPFALLGVPFPSGPFILGLSDPATIEKFTVDDRAANTKLLGKLFGCFFRSPAADHRFFKGGVGNEKLSGELVADHLDAPLMFGQSRNISIVDGIDAAGVE